MHKEKLNMNDDLFKIKDVEPRLLAIAIKL